MDAPEANLFVGVDAGGSRTVAALARGHELVRTVDAETANPNVVGIADAAQIIARSIEGVLGGERAAAIVAGVAGAGSAAMQDELRRSLELRFAGVPIAITHDARIALRAAVPQGDGIVLIAGTGSIAYAEVDGQGLFAGGYGYLLGDSGSGYGIGATALRDRIDAGDRDLLARIYRSPAPVAEIAAHARSVLEAASAGDDRALQIVREAAESLFGLIRTLFEACGRPSMPVVLAGGLLREHNALTERLLQRIGEGWLHVNVIETRVEPYVGALVEARKLSGLP